MTAPAALLARVRRACPSGIWSSGVKIARAGAVALESRSEEEIVLRVRAAGRTVAPTVVLYPGEGEWDCDCGGRVSPCEHVAACVISLGQEDAEPLPAPTQAWAHIAYRLSRGDGGLRLDRVVIRGDGREEPLVTSLAGLLARPADAAELHPEQADLQADRLLEVRTRAVLHPDKLLALLEVLVGCPRVSLDGQPVTIAEEVILPRAVIEDAGDEVVVIVERDPRVTEVLSVGVALCGGALHRLGELETAGGFLQNLPQTRRFPSHQLGELVTKLLPDLTKRMPVDLRSRRLPGITRDLTPRIAIDLKQLGGGLQAMPTLVYGSPPCARIDDRRMVHLGGPVPVRDEPAERRLLERLREELGLLPGRRTTFEGPDAVRFADKLRRWRGDLSGDAAAMVRTDLRLVPRLGLIEESIGGRTEIRFDLGFQVESPAGAGPGRESRSVDAEAVVRAWRDGLGLVALAGGGWAPLPQAWLDRHGQKIADLLAARDADGRLARHALPVLGELCEDLDHPAPPSLAKLEPLAAGFEGLAEPDLPADLAATLRPYQRHGVAWLDFLRGAGLGGVLADDMGLGKTLQALCVLDTRPAESAGALVVCPTSLIHNWAAEARRFRPGLRVCLYHGPARKLEPEADVTVTSYALLRLDGEALQAIRWSTAVLDEAQAIKNPDSQVARAAYGLRADFRIVLTGTPVENRLDELWSLLHFTNRGLLGGRSEFDERFTRPIAAGDQAAVAGLRQRVRPFVLRRLKRDVAPELPPRTESAILVDLADSERAVYDAVHAATRADVVAALDRGGGPGVLAALEALLRLRQAACHPALVPGQTAATSSKVEALVGALETAVADGHRALVFSQWTSFLDLIEPALKEASITFTRLDGTTRDRAGVSAGFQAADGPPVMLVSLKAGGTGLNLTAADHVFLCDPWWNPAVEAQAADRAHRIGQERPVMVYRLVSVGTVEERIVALQERKRALLDAAIGDGAAAAALSRDDLLALLS